MLRHLAAAILLSCGLIPVSARGESGGSATVLSVRGGSFTEKLAAKEVRRYVYLRTGKLVSLVELVVDQPFPTGPLIVVGRKDRPEIAAIPCAADLKARMAALGSEEYLLKTLRQADRPVLVVCGGDAVGTLYGAYRLAEHLGVRFYLHGDVVPDRQIALELPTLDETRKPLFVLRGIQPFHDFPEGPDWWSRDGYKAVLGQLPKMGMNFIGLHAYSTEPLVWTGPPSAIAPDGKVKASYPTHHCTTRTIGSHWGYCQEKTSNYVFGAAEMFDRDDYGVDYMNDVYPWEKMSPEQCNALFNRLGEFLKDVFTYARRLGIKTCVGTETPLRRNQTDPAVVQTLYEGMFQRIAKIHPLDYYWLWTPEDWTFVAPEQAQIDATIADFRTAIAAAKKMKSPFTLATCGWVLGPPQSPALFDELLPKDVPMSCINRHVGNSPVEPGFAKVAGRPKWAIPWLEDDGGMTLPQLWVGRMRRDAFDALQYGCTGLMGIHWRTRILGPNVSALANAAWDQRRWSDNAGPVAASRYLPTEDFYADWTRAEFGPEAAEPLAAIFTRLDGRLPRPATWVTGPGSIKPDESPWEKVRKEYTFIDELAALRPQIVGPGNLERFDYWLNNFRYLRSIAEMRCVWGRFNVALAKVKAEKDPQAQKKLARELALPARKELVTAFADLHRHLLATVSNSGEMGNVCNWQQQTLPVMLTRPGQELAKLLDEQLPAGALPSKRYDGAPRLFVPEVRSGIVAGETLKLTVIVLGVKPQAMAVHWRPLGTGEFAKVPLTHVARGVYTATLPVEAVKDDFEYNVEGNVGGQPLVFPPTAPAMNQTVVTSSE